MLLRKETEIVTTARQIELGERSYREVSPSAEVVETSREEALKEAIRHVTSPAEKEDGKLDYNDKDFRGKRGSKKR